jgi:hypothetical protein
LRLGSPENRLLYLALIWQAAYHGCASSECQRNA